MNDNTGRYFDYEKLSLGNRQLDPCSIESTFKVDKWDRITVILTQLAADENSEGRLLTPTDRLNLFHEGMLILTELKENARMRELEDVCVTTKAMDWWKELVEESKKTEADEEEYCEWTKNKETGTWETSCGRTWTSEKDKYGFSWITSRCACGKRTKFHVVVISDKGKESKKTEADEEYCRWTWKTMKFSPGPLNAVKPCRLKKNNPWE